MIELELYRNIRRLYNEGHSQRQISRILGCARKTIRKYCRGAVLHDARATKTQMELPLGQALEKGDQGPARGEQVPSQKAAPERQGHLAGAEG